MPNIHTAISCLFVSAFLSMSSPVYAHGDHKASTEPVQSPGAAENIYSAESGSPASPDADLPLSRMDIVLDEPKEMHDEHADHKMQNVKTSSHEWVSTSQKGYGAAVGITILAGLFFCALSFMRPNE